MPVVQTFVIRYLDKQKLHNLLKTLFSGADYEWEVHIDFLPLPLKHIDPAWQIKENNIEPTVTLRNIPRKLTEVILLLVLKSKSSGSMLTSFKAEKQSVKSEP